MGGARRRRRRGTLQDYVAANAAAFAKQWCTLPWCGGRFENPEAARAPAQRDHRVPQLPGRAGLLELAGEDRRAWAIRQPGVERADVVISSRAG